MINVFISYAKEDAAAAKILSDALQRAGFSVWWDRHIPPGKTWDSFIGRSLDAANCVLVLWSKFSVDSRWVREEAERGARRRCLIPVLVEPVEPPLGFARIEAANLCAWRGDENDPEFASLRAAVLELVGAAAPSGTPLRANLDQDFLEKVKHSLTRYIGPIAGVLVDRTSKHVTSRQQLYEALATHIPSQKDREKFLRSVPR